VPETLETYSEIYLSTSIGAVLALLSTNLNQVPDGFFSSLATIQAAILGVVFALYILSSQLAADKYTSRILAVVDQSESYTHILALYGVSLLFCVVSMLFIDFLNSNMNIASIAVFLTTSTASGSFLSLFTLREELLEQAHPRKISQKVSESIDQNYVRRELSNSQPFSDHFEAAYQALKAGDYSAATRLAHATCQPINSNIESVLSRDLSNEEELRTRYVVNQVRKISDSGVEEEEYNLVMYLHTWLIELIEKSYGQNSFVIPEEGIGSLFDSLVQVHDGTEGRVLTLVSGDKFQTLFFRAVEQDHHHGVYLLCENTASLCLDVEERKKPLDDRLLSVFNIILEAFFNGWLRLLETKVEQPDSDQLGMLDPGGMITIKYEYGYNLFFSNFDSIAKSILRFSRGSIPTGGIFDSRNTVVSANLKIGAVALDQGHRHLALLHVKMALILSFGLQSTTIRTRKISTEISNQFIDGHVSKQIVRQALSDIKIGDQQEILNQNQEIRFFSSALVDIDDWDAKLETFAVEIEDTVF
jgi:hypothetical protein